jgi:hypothetical protein
VSGEDCREGCVFVSDFCAICLVIRFKSNLSCPFTYNLPLSVHFPVYHREIDELKHHFHLLLVLVLPWHPQLLTALCYLQRSLC